MPNNNGDQIAEVIAVHPNRVRIAVYDIDAFRKTGSAIEDENAIRVGSYIHVKGDDAGGILAMIDNFTLEPTDNGQGRHIIEATPIGFLSADKRFTRGATRISIPPAGVEPASNATIKAIFDDVKREVRFEFAKLASSPDTPVPVDGDKFFNKHIAIVGSTGSGKSHTIASIFQRAIAARDSDYQGLNNAHIIIFDLHGEYKSAFPQANLLSVDNLRLPYWLMNAEELDELLVDSGENQAYNQISLLRRLIRLNKQVSGADARVTVDTPCRFNANDVLRALININREYVVSKDTNRVYLRGGVERAFANDEEKWSAYFASDFEFEQKQGTSRRGPFDDLDRLISRMQAKLSDPRLEFLFGDASQHPDLDTVLRQVLGYKASDTANVTVFDLSGIPFEVLSLTVSLVSRIVFDFAYHLKRAALHDNTAEQKAKSPFLLVYEEAHKYIPRTRDVRYRACRTSIERVAKEGRKYGATLAIVSQRPSEISETIFSQCNNFVAMRLTNPDDQGYVRRLLPDSLGPLIEALPTLPQGDALLIGDAVVMPSQVTLDRCNPEPSSDDIRYLQEWKRSWFNAPFNEVAKRWLRR